MNDSLSTENISYIISLAESNDQGLKLTLERRIRATFRYYSLGENQTVIDELVQASCNALREHLAMVGATYKPPPSEAEMALATVSLCGINKQLRSLDAES